MPQTRSLILTLIIIVTSPFIDGVRANDQQQVTDPRETPSEGRNPDVHYVPTPQYIVNVMLELAQVNESDVLYDLGCGDGRIVITAAKKFGCKAVGVDIDAERVRESRANVKAAGLEHLVTIEQADIFTLDLSQADVVMLYLRPELNVRLIPQLDKMKPGSRVVSHDFDMQGVAPDTEVTFRSRAPGGQKVYLWNVPLNKIDISAVKPRNARPRPSFITVKTDTIRRIVIGVLGLSLVLGALLWLFRKRLGVIKFSVSIDRQ